MKRLLVLWGMAAVVCAQQEDNGAKAAAAEVSNASPRVLHMLPWQDSVGHAPDRLGWHRDVQMIREPFSRESFLRERQLRQALVEPE